MRVSFKLPINSRSTAKNRNRPNATRSKVNNPVYNRVIFQRMLMLGSAISPILQHIARTAHGVDELWTPRVDLGAQVADIDLQDVGLAREIVAPDRRIN